ncbi:LamG-like jellyroll fold domain-containing protein [Sinosporangium siamense]|uniref:LamG-like jellyroll fold domain-containing protein n=1 Tax=Sinosporangium siamense TaxID=1367973 RepID=UPI00194E65B8|nr:LamG-like jellyroll fold domain-containing protein [Sinosporangium siamense]
MATRTPELQAYAHAVRIDTVIDYQFTICDNVDMTGTGCETSLWSTDRTWKVPVGKLKWSKQYWWRVTAREGIESLTQSSPVHSFTTGVIQPSVTSQLSARGANGQAFHHLAGNYTTAFTDAVVKVAGPPLSVVRSYNSLDHRTTGMFGAGWSTRWDMRVRQETIAGVAMLLVTYPDGREVRFGDNGDGTFQPPPGMHATLGVVAGGGWRLMDKSGTVYVFDGQGRLTSVTDVRGRAQTLVYGAGGRLETVTGAGGRSLSFTWSGDRVASVSTAPVNGTPLTWTYEYTSGSLTKVCLPQPAPNNCTDYTYEAGSNYRNSVVNSAPEHYWRLGEAAGSATGANAGSAGETANYGNVTLGVPGALAGTIDTAAEFANSAVYLPNQTVAAHKEQGSVELWIKTTGSGTVLSAHEYGSTSSHNATLLYVGVDGRLRGSFDESATPITTGAPVNDGQWHHIVLTIFGNTQTMFLDGQQVGTLTAAGVQWKPGAQLGDGEALPGHSPSVPGTAGTRTAFPYSGAMDEVAVYDRPLMAAEVQQHYNARLAEPRWMKKITLPSGRVWMENTFDAATDRIKTHTDENGGVWQIGAPVYTPATGKSTVTVTDPRNGTMVYTHDAWRGYRLVSETDQLSKTTLYEYDTGGFISEIDDRNGIVVQQTHDKRGNLLTTKDCDPAIPGACTVTPDYYTYHLNAADEFDPRNDQLVAYRDARSGGPTDNSYLTTWEYNQYGEQTKETTPPVQGFPSGRSATTTYTDGTEPAVGGGTTPAGLIKTETDARGATASYKYNSAGDLAEETDAPGLIIRYEYDAIGRTAARVEVSQAEPAGVRTTFTYNGLGQVLTHTGAGVRNEVTRAVHTAETRNTYNADGKVLTSSVVDLTGGDPERKVVYTYDARGRVETVTGAENGTVTHTWDNTGARTSTTDELGHQVVYAYTPRGELATRTLKNWTGSPVAPQPPADLVLESFAYDFEGRLASTTNSAGRTISRTYLSDDSLAKVTAVGVRLNASTTGRDVVLEENIYDAAGNLSRRITGGGAETVNFVHDAADRVISQTFDPNGLARTVEFTYDANDNVTRQVASAAGTTRTESVETVYNADDLPVRRTVENGAVDLVTTWTRDDRGLVTAMTSPRGNLPGATGHTTNYTYDKAGRLIEAVAPQVQVERDGAAASTRPTTRAGYDNAGNRTHIVDAEGRTSTTAYDRLGRVVSTRDAAYFAPLRTAPAPPTGVVGRWKMDEGTGTALADAVGGRTANLAGTTAWTTGRTGAGVRFDAGTHAVTATPALTTNASYTVSAWVRLTRGDVNATAVSQTGASGSAFKVAYDAGDGKRRMVAYEADTPAAAQTQAVSNRAAKLNEWTHLVGVYDAAAGRIRLYENGEATAAATYTSAWNSTGGLLIGAGKHNGAYEHSFRGDIDEVHAYSRALNDNEIRGLAGATPATHYSYDAAGRVTGVIKAIGVSWNSEYDALGNRVRVTEPAANPPMGARGVWVYEYNTVGELLSVTDPTGAKTGSTYDDLGRVNTATIVERKPTLNTFVTTLEYDDAGNKTKETGPDYRVTLYELNAAGEVTAETDPMLDTTRYEYDLAGRAVKVINPLGNATVTEFDLAGREIGSKDLNATGTVLRQTSTGYDADGNPTSETSAEGHTVQRTYDASGEVTQLVEPVNATQSITTTFGYDALGNPTRSTDGRGNTVWTTYNSLGLVESTIEPSTTAHPQPADRTWTFSYDALGNAVTTLAPGGVRVDRVYDRLDRAKSETGSGAQVATPQRTYSYDMVGRETQIGDYGLDYNDRGLLTAVRKAGRQIAAFNYDAYGNPTERVDDTGTSLFSWDDDDRLATAADPVSGRSFTYGYDIADRLKTLTSATPANSQTFDYDEMDRLLVHTLKDGTGGQLAKITYGWDKDDKLTSKATEGTAGAGNNTYAYDRAGRLTSWTGPAGATTYEWDAAGNRTRAGADNFTYDERNRLTSGAGSTYTYTPRGTLASETTGATTRNLAFDAFDRLVTDGDISYGYDAMGRVTSRTKAGAEERYLYSGIDNHLTAVTDTAGTVQAKYGRDPAGGLLSLQEGTGPAVATMSDLHGDLVATYTGTALVDSAAYDPHGKVVARTGAQRRLGYQGEYTDPDTGKVNMLARWYQPGTGGFISRDDVALSPYPSVNLNRYTYAMGDPLAMTDPSGNCPFCIPLIWVGVRVLVQVAARQIAQRAVPAVVQRVVPQVVKRVAPQATQRALPQAAQRAGQGVGKGAGQTAKKAASEAGKKAGGQTGKKTGAQASTRKAGQETGKKAAQNGSKGKNSTRGHSAKTGQKKPNAKPPKNAKSGAKANKGGPKTNRSGAKAGKGNKGTSGRGSKGNKGTSGRGSKGNKGTGKSGNKGTAGRGGNKGKGNKGNSGRGGGRGKGGNSSNNTTKNDLMNTVVESMLEEAGAEPMGDWRGCTSWRGCAKEVVEDFIENTTDELIDDVIDQVAPELPADSSSDCEGNSFIPGTLVLMADGSRKPIEDIRLGDSVMAADPETGQAGPRPVTALITGEGDKTLVDITVMGEGIQGPSTGTELLTATGNHPFWVPELREWLPASQLTPGMLLQTSAGTYVQISTIEKRTAKQRVHNLTVGDLHTYHVIAGDSPLLVHNSNPCQLPLFVFRDGESAPAREVAASSGGPTAGKNVTRGIRRRMLNEEFARTGGYYECWRCGHTTANPANMAVGHKNVPRSAGGNLNSENLCLEGHACNSSAQDRGFVTPGMSCAERGGCGAGFGRFD